MKHGDGQETGGSPGVAAVGGDGGPSEGRGPSFLRTAGLAGSARSTDDPPMLLAVASGASLSPRLQAFGSDLSLHGQSAGRPQCFITRRGRLVGFQLAAAHGRRRLLRGGTGMAKTGRTVAGRAAAVVLGVLLAGSAAGQDALVPSFWTTDVPRWPAGCLGTEAEVREELRRGAEGGEVDDGLPDRMFFLRSCVELYNACQPLPIYISIDPHPEFFPDGRAAEIGLDADAVRVALETRLRSAGLSLLMCLLVYPSALAGSSLSVTQRSRSRSPFVSSGTRSP